MNRCQRCIQPDTRPGIFFDGQGVCGPCRYFESLEKVDWKVRGRQIKEIAKDGFSIGTALWHQNLEI